MSHNGQEHNRFLAACSVLRGASLSNFEIFDVTIGKKKGPFAAFIIESSLKVLLAYIQKLMWFYLLTTKDSLMSKVSDKTFFRCEMLWTALTEIATRYSTTSRVSPYISFVL